MTMVATAKDTRGVPRSLPDGWRWVRLGDHVSKVGSGLTPLGGQASYSSDGIPLIRSQNVHMNRFVEQGLAFITPEQDDCMRESRVLQRDVLLNITGASIGRVCVVPDRIPPANVNHHVSIIRSDGSIDPWYLSFFLSAPGFQKYIADTQAGATRQALTKATIEAFAIPFAPLSEQERVAQMLREQMAAVERARAAAVARLEAATALPAAMVRETLRTGQTTRHRLGDCLMEIRTGVGAAWFKYPVLGATREGLAPAKEAVGKAPDRYKLVDPVTVFFNPMRILLGSIAMVDEEDPTGITSPDYVVVKGRPGVLDTRWFYYWFRSAPGARLIDSLSRGAVRERILFNRLAAGEIEIPDYGVQLHASNRMEQIRPIIETVAQELNAINALPAALLRAVFSRNL